jgi:hypothetical protein
MANTLTQDKARNVSTVTTVYSVPPATTSTLIGLLVSNVDASATVTIDVAINDGANDFHICKNTPILVGSTLEAVEGKIIMLTGEDLKVTSTGGNVDVIVSHLEQS